jgi:hypothetical protein
MIKVVVECKLALIKISLSNLSFTSVTLSGALSPAKSTAVGKYIAVPSCISLSLVSPGMANIKNPEIKITIMIEIYALLFFIISLFLVLLKGTKIVPKRYLF